MSTRQKARWETILVHARDDEEVDLGVWGLAFCVGGSWNRPRVVRDM